MTIPKDNSQLENARRLRSEMTPHERKLWYLFDITIQKRL
mgnify:CR=1 FL=1